MANQNRSNAAQKNTGPFQEAAKQLILEQETAFQELASKTEMEWRNECLFALQAMTKNDYLAEVAYKNPASLKSAILNVASIGITLNPTAKLAFLVPRDGAVILDISAKGLRTIAEMEGSIACATVVLVHEGDGFRYNGPFQEPTYPDPFRKLQDRGEFIGACCVAKLPTGGVLVDHMLASDIYDIREMSMAYKDRQGNIYPDSPWVRFFFEMAKKVMIKRASKNWPRLSTVSASRMETAVHVLNQHEGVIRSNNAQPASNVVSIESKFQYDPAKVSQGAKEYAEKLIKIARNRNGDFIGAKNAADSRLAAPKYAHDYQYVTECLSSAHEEWKESQA